MILTRMTSRDSIRIRKTSRWLKCLGECVGVLGVGAVKDSEEPVSQDILLLHGMHHFPLCSETLSDCHSRIWPWPQKFWQWTLSGNDAAHRSVRNNEIPLLTSGWEYRDFKNYKQKSNEILLMSRVHVIWGQRCSFIH